MGTKFVKGYTPWNKGLKKENDPRIQMMAKKSYETKIKRYGENYFKELAAKITDKRSDRTLFKKGNTMAKTCRVIENRLAKNLTNKYDLIAYPVAVCDRICIKDNEIIFIEFKSRTHPQLTPKQNEFKLLCEKIGIKYEVIIG